MAIARLTASHFDRTSTYRVTVTNENNMYNNTENSASYTTIRGRNQATSTYIFFLNGFDFSTIPSGSTINSFSVRLKAYRSSNLRTGGDYTLRLSSAGAAGNLIPGTIYTGDVTTNTTPEIYTIPTGELTWSQLSGYGSGFSITVPLRSTDGAYPYIYVYGAEILVDYDSPITNPFRVKNNGEWFTPSKVLVKQNGLWTQATKIYVKDNGSWES